eukprot:SAG22_NODE_534_length_9397_cov_22.325231_3_plen_718_part_00
MLTRESKGRLFKPHPPGHRKPRPTAGAAPQQQLWHETGRQYTNRLILQRQVAQQADRDQQGDGGGGSGEEPQYSSDEDHDHESMPKLEPFAGLDPGATDQDHMRMTQRLRLPQLPLGNITMSTLGGPSWSYTKDRANNLAATRGQWAVGKEQKRETRKMAKRACHSARAVLSDASSSQPALAETIQAIDEALVNMSAVPSNTAYRKKLHTYRAMSHAKSGKFDVALADLKEVLRLGPDDAAALRYQARLRQLLAARFKKAAPSRFVPTLISQDKYLTRVGNDERMDRQFQDCLKDCRRDRVYPAFWDRGKRFTGTREESESEEEEEEAPSIWDYVLRRVSDILVDDQDRRDTRALLLEFMDTISNVFVYYCRLGSQAHGKEQSFLAIKPARIGPRRLSPEARRRFNALFSESSLPPYLLSLRQFWQFCADSRLVGDDVQLADAGRIFVVSSREFDKGDLDIITGLADRGGHAAAAAAVEVAATGEEEEDDGQEEEEEEEEEQQQQQAELGFGLGDEEGRMAEEAKLARLRTERAAAAALGETTTTFAAQTDELSACDMDDPHNRANHQHIFEFAECLLRVARKHQAGHPAAGGKKAANSGGGGGATKMALSSAFQTILAEHVLPYACTHTQMTAKGWGYRRLAQQQCAELYRSPLQMVFHFFTTANPNTAVKSTGGGMNSFWKVRSAELLGKGGLILAFSLFVLWAFLRCISRVPIE